MRTIHNILFAAAAVFAVAGCQHKDLGWPAEGEQFFDRYKDDNWKGKYPTNLQADLVWNIPGEEYPGQNETLYYYFFDKEGKLVHYGEENVYDEPGNWKYHIDSVFTDKAGVQHYNGKYSILCSEEMLMYCDQQSEMPNKFIDGEHLPDESVPVKYMRPTGGTVDGKVPLSELAFSGMDISNVYDNDVPYVDGYTGYKEKILCGTDDEPVDGKYLTTHANVDMNKYESAEVSFKIYRDLNGGNTGLGVNKYALADGMYSVCRFEQALKGKELLVNQTIYFGGDETGDWHDVRGEGYKYTATSRTFKKPAGKVYLFCDFYDPNEESPIVRYRICQVIDYSALVTGDKDNGYEINLENAYPTEAESGLLAFYSEYYSQGSWRTGVSYPVVKLIK